MKTKRFKEYLDRRKMSNPITTGSEIASNPDKKIDEDFPGYPNNPSSKEAIQPKTATEKKTAAVNTKDGEKRNTTPAKKKKDIDEQKSDGSGGAFGATEEVSD